MKLWVWCVVVMGLSGAGMAGQSAPAPASVQCHPRETPPSDAEAALAREEYPLAMELYGKMVKDAAEESRAGVIRTLLGQDKVEDATELAEEWVTAAPKSGAAKEAQGEVLLRAGKIPEAAAATDAARVLDPCNARAYLLASNLEDLAANFKSSRKHVELAHRLAPQDVEIRESWINTLPRKQRLLEQEGLLKDERLVSAEKRGRFQQYLEHAADYKSDDCTLVAPVETAKVPIVAIMDGMQPTGEAGLDVRFNGKERRMELDTGASGILLSKSAASGLGLTRELKVKSGGIGDKGDVPTSTAHVASVKIGTMEFRNCVVRILEKGSALENNGLIGGDVFQKFLLTIDYPKAELRVEPLPKRPDEVGKTEKVGLNTESAVEETSEEEAPQVYDRYIAPEMKDWTKIYRSGHDLLLPMRIGESSVKLFLVDTGAASMLISPQAAREVTKVKNNYDERIQGISGEVNKVYQTGKFRLQFANLYQNVNSMTSIDTTKISHDDGVEVSGFLGDPILYRLAIHIDYRDNLMKFEFPGKK